MFGKYVTKIMNSLSGKKEQVEPETFKRMSMTVNGIERDVELVRELSLKDFDGEAVDFRDYNYESCVLWTFSDDRVELLALLKEEGIMTQLLELLLDTRKEKFVEFYIEDLKALPVSDHRNWPRTAISKKRYDKTFVLFSQRYKCFITGDFDAR